MNKKPKAIIALVLTVLTVALLIWTCFYAGGKYVVFDPKGPIGQAQKELIILSTSMAALLIVPVMILTFFIIWRYRDAPDNKAKYQPHWDDSKKLETVWWAIPIIVICILAVITARYTYLLEPSKPLASTQKPVTIQVTSLDWKWLFMYPEEGIATVNEIHIPKGVPVRFELTADAPMNSFWIPQLGGQIYTMSGMAMKLHLQADHEGTYFGSGANFSGEHFGQMRFDVEVQSDEEYKNWVANIKKQSKPLTKDGYLALAKPGLSQPDEYSSIPDGLFQDIVSKYVVDGASNPHAGHGGHTSTEGSFKSDTEDEAAMDMSHMNMSGHH
ncbi:ubiquinol oxidase subunit II [Paenibacillus peoriae]|uniref:ubiquinol oxidase subunit II n=1 Tax=Paenibacillus peoriae TaxID=59893 RepID=UPI00096D5116|nr:ubiquinol oxidase subunit II [Paenibacillus peoriae]OMF70688.1 ubiquinol oxidase subunit II [Paenibacillus peoriae]